MGNTEETGGTAQSSRRAKSLGIVAIALAAMTLITTMVLAQREDDQATAKMIAVADKLQPPATWTGAGSRITGSGGGCIDMDVRCGSLFRSYDLPATLSPSDFHALTAKVGLDPAATEGTCLDSPYATGLEMFCEDKGVVDGHEVRLQFGSDGTHPTITIYVEKIRN